MRTAAAWLTGIAVWGGIYFGFSALLTAMGIPTYVEFDAPQTITSGRAEWEIDGAHSNPGFAIVFIALILGVMAGVWVFEQFERNGSRHRWSDPEREAASRLADARDRIFLFAALIGLAVFGALTAATYLVLGGASGLVGFLHWVLDLATAALAYFVGRWWFHRRVSQIRKV